MERRTAKELLHIDGWLNRAAEISGRGEEVYLADELLQEAGDSIMMKLGEAANRLTRSGVLAPEGVEWALAVANRNFLIHEYGAIDRSQTWTTLSVDLPAWHAALHRLIEEARATRSHERALQERSTTTRERYSGLLDRLGE